VTTIDTDVLKSLAGPVLSATSNEFSTRNGCIRIVASGDSFVLEGGTFDTRVKASAANREGGNLNALVAKDTLVKFLSVIDSKFVTLVSDGNDLVVKSGSAEWRFPTYQYDHGIGILPLSGDNVTSVSIEAQWLGAALGAALPIADRTHEVLSGVLVEVSGCDAAGACVVHIVATDGRRMAVTTGVGIQASCPFKVVFPMRVIPLITSAIKRSVLMNALVSSNGNSVLLEMGEYLFSFAALGGRYPAWQNVMAGVKSNSDARLECKDAMRLAKLSSLCSDVESHAIELSVSDGKLSAVGKSEGAGKSSAHASAETRGDASEAVDGKYLRDALASVSAEDMVSIEFGDAGMPMAIRTEKGYCAVIMPVKKS